MIEVHVNGALLATWWLHKKGNGLARAHRGATIDLSARPELTAGLIDRLTCPAGKAQAFLRDSKFPGVRVRVTAADAKSYVFEGKLNRQTIRDTIGDVRAWTIPGASVESNRLRTLLDRGIDPRELRREQTAVSEAKQEAGKQHATTFAEAWDTYVEERRPLWSVPHHDDHLKLAQAGGEPRKNRQGVLTVAGPLAELMARPLATPRVLQW